MLLIVFTLLLSACTRSIPGGAPPVTVPTNAPGQLPPSQNLPLATPTQPSIYLPSIPRDAQSSTGACQTHAADLAIAASSQEVRVGEMVTITLSLANTGACAMLGLPKYTLVTSANPAASLFNPASPAPLDHSLGLDPGMSDNATFTLQAAVAGQAVLAGNASFEVHLGNPGPAYWANASSQPLNIIITP